MKTKKNFLLGFLIFSFLLLSLFPVSFVVAADDDDDKGGEPPHKVPGKDKTDLNVLYKTLVKLANWFFSFLMVIAVIGIVASGVMFVFAGGDPSKVATARNMVIYSLLGVLVASFGWVLVNWAQDIVKGS